MDQIIINDVSYPLLRELVPYKENILRKIEGTDFQRNVFLMMKYRDYNDALSKYICEVFQAHGLSCVRADMDGWNLTGDSVLNPLAVLYCCKYGVALFDEPEDGQHFGPNVAYELAIMHNQWKNCLILMHGTISDKKPFDLIVRMHKVYAKELLVKRHIEKWIVDNDLKQKTKTKKRKQRAKIKEDSEATFLRCETHIRILNGEGDCVITERYTVKPLRTHTYKKHVELFSFDSSTDWNSLSPSAHDLQGKSLMIEKDINLPNGKSFFVLVPLIKGEDCGFEYRFNWKGMFPKVQESFSMLNHARNCAFSLEYPLDWNIASVGALEQTSQKSIKPKSKVEGKTEKSKFFRFEFGSNLKGKQLRVFWRKKEAQNPD